MLLATMFVLIAAGGRPVRAQSARQRVTSALPGAVDRARQWLLNQQRADGWFSDSDFDNTMAALALAESNAPLSDDRMKRLVAAMVSAQPPNHRFEAMRVEFLVRMLGKMNAPARKAAEGVISRDMATLSKSQRNDGAWFQDRGNNWTSMEATFAAYQAFSLCLAEGYKVSDEYLTRPVVTLLQKQKSTGPWTYNPFDNPDGDSFRDTTLQAVIALMQVGGDSCTCRSKGPTKIQEALQKALEKAMGHGEVQNAYADWARDPNKVRDAYFWQQGYYLARLQQVSPRETIGRANLFDDWYRNTLRMQQDDGHAESPSDDRGRNQNVMTTACMLYQFAQMAKPVLVSELVDDPSKVLSANRGLLNAVETLSLRSPQPMRYDRARPGLDLERYRQSPLAYLHATEAFRLAQEERDNLRRYVTSGGTILVQLDCGDKAVLEAVRREMAAIWPAGKIEALIRNHPMWTAGSEAVAQRPVVLGLDDGVRTFAYVFQVNLICDLARGRSAATQPAFQTFDAIAAYALEGQMDLAAPLLEVQAEPAEIQAGAVKEVGLGLIKLKSSGPEGTAMPYDGWATVAALFPKGSGAKLLGPRPVEATGGALAMCDLAYLPCREESRLEDDEAAAVSAYLAGGGMLLLESRLGSVAADRGAQRIIAALKLKTRPAKADDALLSGKFAETRVGFALQNTHQRQAGALRKLPTDLRLLLSEDNRVVGVYSPYDLIVSAAGIRCYGLRGYAPVDARRLLANLLISRIATR